MEISHILLCSYYYNKLDTGIDDELSQIYNQNLKLYENIYIYNEKYNYLLTILYIGIDKFIYLKPFVLLF
tara:strand:- start:1905 stop:2114 length:210 start_codon:yes stop_codon:yes gene_type:complete